MNASERYYYAMGVRWLVRLYDPLIRITMPEGKIKSALVEQVGLKPGQRVLDLGAGTGTLALMLKRAQPQAEVVGVDGDRRVLDLARAKATKAGLAVTFDEATADALPYPDAFFDRVVSSFVFHHLSRETKRRALGEALRVLKSGGEVHLADWGPPHKPIMRVPAFFLRFLEKAARVADNLAGRLPELFRDAGFANVRETASYGTMFGTVTFYQAKKDEQIH
jgi:ubiquinone/menaquinone biosynthesis C-methylase UbiE